MGEGINCSIMREKEGERISAPTRMIAVFLKPLTVLHSVLICDCLTFLIFCAQSQWRTRVIASQTLLVPPPCTDTWTAIISRWTHQDNCTLGYIMSDDLHQWQQVFFTLLHFLLFCLPELLPHRHTCAYWRTFTHTTALMYGQQTWVWFRFVDILSGLESGLLWKPRISPDTRAFSPCRMVFGYRIEFSVTLADSCRQTRSEGETQREHTPMPVHVWRTLCQWNLKQFSLILLTPFPFLFQRSHLNFSPFGAGAALWKPQGARGGGLTGSSVYM